MLHRFFKYLSAIRPAKSAPVKQEAPKAAQNQEALEPELILLPRSSPQTELASAEATEFFRQVRGR